MVIAKAASEVALLNEATIKWYELKIAEPFVLRNSPVQWDQEDYLK